MPDQLDEIDLSFICLDCKVNTSSYLQEGIAEYYSLKDDIWFSIVPKNINGSIHNNGMLCIGCVEKRLGRLLTRSDFQNCPLNDLEFPWKRSQRLIDRLSRK